MSQSILILLCMWSCECQNAVSVLKDQIKRANMGGEIYGILDGLQGNLYDIDIYIEAAERCSELLQVPLPLNPGLPRCDTLTIAQHLFTHRRLNWPQPRYDDLIQFLGIIRESVLNGLHSDQETVDTQKMKLNRLDSQIRDKWIKNQPKQAPPSLLQYVQSENIPELMERFEHAPIAILGFFDEAISRNVSMTETMFRIQLEAIMKLWESSEPYQMTLPSIFESTTQLMVASLNVSKQLIALNLEATVMMFDEERILEQIQRWIIYQHNTAGIKEPIVTYVKKRVSQVNIGKIQRIDLTQFSTTQIPYFVQYFFVNCLDQLSDDSPGITVWVDDSAAPVFESQSVSLGMHPQRIAIDTALGVAFKIRISSRQLHKKQKITRNSQSDH